MSISRNDSAEPRILVTVDLSLCPQALEPLRRVGQVEYIPDPTQEQVESILADFDVYIGHVNIRITDEMLAKAERLQLVATCSTGTDHLDKQALEKRGIQLISLTTEYALLNTFTSTAELAWLLLMSCNRRLPRLFERAKQGEVGPDATQTPPHQLLRKTLGVVGYGRLGKMVIPYGLAFRMRVLVCDPYKQVDHPGIEQVDFDTLIEQADFISLHVHLNDQTRHMIDRDVLLRTKPGVVIVNVSRGDVIREDALLEALERGHVAAAGLDVVHNEWDPDLKRRPILAYARTHDNLVVTPHVGGCSLESLTDARVFIADKVVDFTKQCFPVAL